MAKDLDSARDIIAMSLESDVENLLTLDSSDEDSEHEFFSGSNEADTTSEESAVLRHLLFMYDGSISARGYFDGLELRQAHRSLLHLQQEYQRFIDEHASNTGDDISPLGISKVATPLGPEIITNDTTESPCELFTRHVSPDHVGAGMAEEDEQHHKSRNQEQKRFLELQITWGKRNWRGRFELYNEYDGVTRLTLTEWNRLLTWFWSTLSEEYMTGLHEILVRLRTTRTNLPNLTFVRNSGLPRSQLQQTLIRDYHKVMHSENTKDIVHITQRFHLMNLYRSHSAYLEDYRSRGMTTQTARQRVNQLLLDIFRKEFRMPISQQVITNHLKEGRHWFEIANSSRMKHFAYGLLLVLPVDGYTDVARKTSDSVWHFLFQQLSRISYRTVELATAFQPIAKSLQLRGVGNVDAPLSGYELREATNLHELSRPQFNACLASYPDLPILDTLNTIIAHGRVEDPNQIRDLIKENWLQQNRRDAFFFQQRADNLRQSSERDIRYLEREAHMRLQNSMIDDNSAGGNLTPLSSCNTASPSEQEDDIETPLSNMVFDSVPVPVESIRIIKRRIMTDQLCALHLD